jgi:hypothetical protein
MSSAPRVHLSTPRGGATVGGGGGGVGAGGAAAATANRAESTRQAALRAVDEAERLGNVYLSRM